MFCDPLHLPSLPLEAPGFTEELARFDAYGAFKVSDARTKQDQSNMIHKREASKLQ